MTLHIGNGLEPDEIRNPNDFLSHFIVGANSPVKTFLLPNMGRSAKEIVHWNLEEPNILTSEHPSASSSPTSQRQHLHPQPLPVKALHILYCSSRPVAADS